MRIFETTVEGDSTARSVGFVSVRERLCGWWFVGGRAKCGVVVGHLPTPLLARGIWGLLIGLVRYEMLVYRSSYS